MTDKRNIHHWWRVMRRIKIWQLIVLLFLSGTISVELLRQNNLGMIDQRNAVKVADASGDQQRIRAALVDLQHYVSSHMNTDMGSKGIYLEKTYQQAYERAIQNGIKSNTASKDLYNQADAACQSVFNKTYSFPAYTQCVAGKLAGQPGNDPLNSVQTPSVDLYRYNFVSPVWTPDAAGIAVAITCLIALLLVSRLFLVWIMRLLLRRHNSWS